MFFNRNKKRLHHFMMRPVFFMVLVFGVDSVASAKTLVFQSQSQASPEQLLVSNSAEPLLIASYSSCWSNYNKKFAI